MRNLDFQTAFEGRIVKAPRVKEDESKTQFFFTVAIDTGYKDKASGEWKDRTRFVDCMIRCNNNSITRLNYLKDKLLLKGHKVKGCGEISEAMVDIDKTTNEPYKDANGNYKAHNILFVNDIKLVAKPNGNPVPTSAPEPSVTTEEKEDLPF